MNFIEEALHFPLSKDHHRWPVLHQNYHQSNQEHMELEASYQAKLANCNP
jgi:hypothetical protein